MGERIEFRANGRTAPGYFAAPASGTGPAMVVIQEYWGLVPHIEDLVNRFAAAGFLALAPDLYHGEEAKSPDEAGKLMMALNIAEAGKDLHGAAQHLLGLDGVSTSKVATIGFCMGGQLALYAACEYPDLVGAAIDFYGIHPAVTLDVARLSGPVQAHFATRDHSTPPDAANALIDRIRAAGRVVEPYFYEADHAFFNDQRPKVYDPEAAGLAWSRVLEFLRRELR